MPTELCVEYLALLKGYKTFLHRIFLLWKLFYCLVYCWKKYRYCATESMLWGTHDGRSGAARVEVWYNWPQDVVECAPYPRDEVIFAVEHQVCLHDRLGFVGLVNYCGVWGWGRRDGMLQMVVRGYCRGRLEEEGI